MAIDSGDLVGGGKSTVTHEFELISSGLSGLLATLSPVTAGNNVVLEFLAVQGGGASEANIEVKIGSDIVILNDLLNTANIVGNPMTAYRVGSSGSIQRIVAPPDTDITVTKTSGTTGTAISIASSEEAPA